jgi:uncharacterized delta-60 repeat protein
MSTSMERLEERRLLSAGEIDTTFGNGGAVTLFDAEGSFSAITTLSDGGFVVAGQAGFSGSPDQLRIARYLRDGLPDTSFLDHGGAIVNLGGTVNAQHLFVRSDNRLVISGTIDDTPFTLRLRADGALDATFARHGILRGFEAQAMQSDGDLLGATDDTISRRSPRGVLDPTFGDGGSVVVSNVPSQDVPSIQNIVVQPNGKIVVVGVADGGLARAGFARRLDASGKSDASFGDAEFDATDEYSNPLSVARTAAALSPDGKLVIAASEFDRDTAQLYEVGAGGATVSTFHSARFYGQISDLAVQSDGKIVAMVNDGVARVLPDGSTDVRFHAGLVKTLGAQAIALQPGSGDILIAGTSSGADYVPYPSVSRVSTTDNGAAIQFFSQGNTAFYGTGKADHIAVTRSLTDFTFTIDGVSKKIARTKVNRIWVWAEGGNDTITLDGRNTREIVYCGAGDDTVKLLSGYDAFVYGDAGNDFISGAGLDPHGAHPTGGLGARGGAGNDHIIGSSFGDYIEGDSGNDTLDGGGASDGLYGGSGNDLLIRTGGISRGGAGDDTLIGGGNGDTGHNTYL